ncbi:MAG: AMP-binding protein [Rubrivivax sp.]
MAPARHLGVEPTGAGFKPLSGALPPPVGPSVATTEAPSVAPELEHSPLLAAHELLDQPAIVDLDRMWTWRQVHQASIELAGRLSHASAVCNLCNSRLNFLVTWLAALRCRTPMVLPPSGGHADLAGVLKSTPRPVIVVDHEKAIQPGWRSSADCLVGPSSWPSAKGGATDATWLPDWHCSAALLYTSGSTGAPEPHPKTLLQLVSGALALGDRLAQDVAGGLSAMRRIVCSVPPQHMFGFEASVMLPLVHGIPVCEGRPLLPGDVQQAFAGSPASAWVTTPLHMRALVRSGDTLPNCALVLASTMPLTQQLARQTESLVSAPVLEIYGSTETGVIAMRCSAHETSWRPVRGVRVAATHDATLSWGAHFSSPVRLPDETEIDATGCFKLLGRSTDMVKIGGRRASLAGLNLLLEGLPGLEDGALYLPNTRSPTERLCLIYSGPALDRAGVEEWLRGRLDPAFMPRTFVHVDSLPRSESGKLPRQAMDALFAAWQHRNRRSSASGEA